MRCARCEFENIPGQTRCIRCGSILEAGGGVALEVHPPRMAAWRAPFRAITRWLRRQRSWPEESPASLARRRFEAVISDGLVGTVVSIVPGLAHLLKGRFREVALYVGLWFFVLSAGLFCYGTVVGSLLVGLAIGLHACIALQYGLFEKVTALAERTVCVLLAVAAFAAMYWMAFHVVPPRLVGGHTTLTIPARDIEAGDYFIARRVSAEQHPLPRGTLVLIRPPRIRNNIQVMRGTGRDLVVGQVVGLPGERVRVRGTTFLAGEQVLDAEQYPVPGWLQGGRRASVLSTGTYVSPGSYFISSQYNVTRHGRVNITEAMVRNACVLEASDIRGRAFLHWWPLSRRGFLE